jgi:hypothetical protein
MAKTRKKKNKKRQQSNVTNENSPLIDSNGNQDIDRKDNSAQEIERLSVAAMANVTESDLKALDENPQPAPDSSLEDLITKASEALALLEVQRDRAKKEEETAKAKSTELEESHHNLESDREMAQLKHAEAEESKKAVKAKEKALLEREENLLKRELDADAGFEQRNRQALERLDKEAQSFREEFSNHRARIASEREAWEKEMLDRRTTFDEETHRRRSEIEAEASERIEHWKADVEKREAELEAREAELKAESTKLRKEARNIEVERELLAEDKQAATERAERIAASMLEEKDSEISALQERLTAARHERDNLGRSMSEREDADRRFDGRTPEEVLAELRKLRQEREKLRKALGGRPSAEAFQRLEELERQRERWEAERLSLIGDVAEHKQRLARKNIAVTELEALRDHKAALEASNALLTKALEDEIRKVNDLVRGADGASPFPSCSGMDNNNDLQATRPTTDNIPRLREFAEYVRHRMACDPKTEKTLYYSAADVRSFIGGLSMSRLHLLQGISGTGKTSLPLAFARAIGAGYALIAVQAGWRDRQDLIGHFNTFETRFHESEFLQALYKARCPRYQGTPFIVVLDEMNLSHPEQYFADLLSALEQEQHRQRLVLMTAPVKPAPALMDEGGKVLSIPANVWFVGTANHDETTKDFADKTYDRAHVMELPRHREVFKVNDKQTIQPVGKEALLRAFENAVEVHATEAKTAYDFLEQHLGDILGRKFRVGWGNRLQRQMEDYVPVVIKCGGSIGEATDHMLASKLLRKIRDRHDNRPEDIIALRERIRAEWPSFDPNSPPSKSLGILHEELHRLGHDED